MRDHFVIVLYKALICFTCYGRTDVNNADSQCRINCYSRIVDDTYNSCCL